MNEPDGLKVLMTGTVILMIIAGLTAIRLDYYEDRHENFCKKQARTTTITYADDGKTRDREQYYNRDAYDRCMESLVPKE